MADATCRVIELTEGPEVEFVESNEYVFDKIGASVPLSPGGSRFDPSTLPSQPLVVSERRRLLFIAHSDGFLVASTPDVIRSAKEIKEQGTGPSLSEICVVNVCIGKVNILALSGDSRILAATVGSDIHFFLVDSLLIKEQTPHSSCSLDAPEYVKDMRWTNKNGESYIVLSNNGNLYRGAVGGSLQHVFGNVDAVEWSVNQSLIALARKNTLSILSHDCKETLSMSLCFDSWIDGADDDYFIKVDSIRWARPDCIILGCLKVTADGTEENYLVQAISVKGGSFTDTSSEPIVSSFDELFTGIMDDIVPFETGPHLFLSYLRQCELGIIANKKNVDQHINLISWSSGDLDSEVAVIVFDRDKWAPRIPLQDNDDDNVIVGLCIDGVSVYEKVRFQQGVDDPKELSPYCVLFCLTLEGKLIMFHLASISDTPSRHQSTLFSDEETTGEISEVRLDQLQVDSETEQPKHEDSVLRFQSQEVSKNDQLQMEGSECPKSDDATDIKIQGNSVGYTCLKSLETKTNEPPERHIQPLLEQNRDTLARSANLGLPETHWNKSSLGTYNVSQGGQGFKDGLNLVSSNNMGVASSYVSSENPFNDSQNRIAIKDLNKVTNSGTVAKGELGMSFANSFSNDPCGGSLFSSSSNSQAHKHASSDSGAVGRNMSKDSGINHSIFRDTLTSNSLFQPPPTKLSSNAGPSVSPKIEALPSVRKSQLLFQQQNIPDSEFQSLNNRTKSFHGKLSTDANLSKGSINIREMTEQLDKLLKDLEETDGLADLSTGQTNSAEALRNGLEALACKCKTWKSIIKERHEDIQGLLNKTVQVVARKTYVEGIVKQASDTQYWDLWDRQGLGFELEMKHRNIIKIHQELVNQLIQLEMHFNNLELNKFGQKDRAYDNRRGLQNQLREPRHIQSLHSLQNTMNSQLIVAEQLSQCLSEQMALLNVDSPFPKQQNVKRDLFKTIGLPLDDTAFNSPAYSPMGKHSVPSLSASVKDLAKRNQTSGYKNPEPETARRRRESLGRSWVAFEPHKTTVRRSPLRENRKPDAGKPWSIPCMLEESVSSQKERRTPSALNPLLNRDVQETVTVGESKRTSRFKWVSNDTGPLQTDGPVSPAKSSLLPFSSQSSSLKPLFGHDNSNSTGSLISKKAVAKGTSGTDPRDTKSTLLADSEHDGANPDRPYNKTPMTSQPQVQEIPLLRSTMRSNFSISSKGMGTPSAQGFVSSEIPVMGGKALHLDAVSSQSHSVSKVVSFPASSSTTSLFSSASSVSAASSLFPPSFGTKYSPPADDPLSKPLNNCKSSSEASRSTFPLSTSPSLFSSLSSAASSDNSQVSLHPKKEEPSLSTATSLVEPNVTVAAESAPSESSPPTFNFTQKIGDHSRQISTSKSTDEGKLQSNGIGASDSSTSCFSSKLEDATRSEQKVQEEVKLSEQSSFGGLANAASSSVLKSQLEHPLSTFNGSTSTEKTEASGNAVSQEEEMEEQAPEVNPMSELSLGSLGAFGLGSTPTQAAANPIRNPFGGSLGSSSGSPVSSPFTITSSVGEMFRPASFSFSPTQSQPAPSQPTAFGGFGSSATPVGFGFAANQAPSGIGFGQPAQVGQGQQALGSVLGSFGQSRQIGIGQPANSFAPVSSFGSGFTGNLSAGGFANAAPKSGGFASLASNSGGFAAAASTTSGGFGVAAPAGGGGFVGFAAAASATSGGFGVTAPAGGGGGFGGFAGSGAGFGAAGGSGFGQQGSSFSAFSGKGTQPPAELLTQMRK